MEMTTNSGTQRSSLPSHDAAGFKAIPALLRDRRRRWALIVPAALVIVIAGGLVYYQNVYLPAQVAKQSPLETTTATRGDLTVSIQGTGILQPAAQVQLGFGTSGKIASITVKPGDQVKQGQILAQLDNTSQQVKYQQAQRAHADFTSAAAIAQAQGAVAKAQDTLTNAQYALMQVISPAVFYSEQKVEADQAALAAAQSAGGSSPTAEQQQAIDAAQAQLKKDQAELAGNQMWYQQVYLPLNYTVKVANPTSTSASHKPVKLVKPPSQVEIDTAQANYDVAKTTLQQDQWYLDALSGKDIPANAGGTNLASYLSAKFALQSAQATLAATQITAPAAGTVLTVSDKIGDNVGTTPFIVVGDLSSLYLQTYVSEKDYQEFKVGREADIVFDALPAQNFLGKVVQVNPGLDTSTNTPVVSGLVALNPTTTPLLVGMSASVNVVVGRAQGAVLVPLAALHEYAPGKYAVFVMRDGKLNVDFVQVGLQGAAVAEVTSGLNPGDVVSTGLLGTK